MCSKSNLLLMQERWGDDRKRAWQRGYVLAVVAIVVVLLAAATTAFLAALSFNPLPRDEEMIAHFNAHRADFETLQKKFREYQLPVGEKPRYWAATPENEALMKKTGIDHVDSAGALWLPRPYSIETARHLDSLIRKRHGIDLFRQYGALMLWPVDKRYFTKSLRYLTDFAIWKDFYHIPEMPRITDGLLIGPMKVSGTFDPGYRVFASLDDYPTNWKRGECVLRQIDKHWFIRMCRAA